MLPYCTGTCCYAFIYIFFIASVHFFFFFSPFFLYFFENLVLINGRNGPWYHCVLALCVFVLFFNRGNTEETNSSKKLRVSCLCVLFCVNLCRGWFCRFLRICSLMTCVQNVWEADCFYPWYNPLWLTGLKVPTNWLNQQPFAVFKFPLLLLNMLNTSSGKEL